MPRLPKDLRKNKTVVTLKEKNAVRDVRYSELKKWWRVVVNVRTVSIYCEICALLDLDTCSDLKPKRRTFFDLDEHVACVRYEKGGDIKIIIILCNMKMCSVLLNSSVNRLLKEYGVRFRWKSKCCAEEKWYDDDEHHINNI